MNYMEPMKRALEYIETNLKTELNLTELAKASGYSEYHFLRIFKAVTQHTPADYIRKRRLSEIVREIDKSGRAVSDIAYEYGFNSKENFTRAFKTEHNVAPTEYRSAGNSLKLFDRFALSPPTFEVTPTILSLERFELTGFYSSEEYIPKFWNQYNCKKQSTRLTGGKIVADYGVSQWNPGINRLDYYIGVRSEDAAGDTTGAVRIDIPGGQYAVFSTPAASHFAFVSTIHRTWHFTRHVWMPQSAYRYAPGNPYRFEVYVEVSRTYSEDIYIPIEMK